MSAFSKHHCGGSVFEPVFHEVFVPQAGKTIKTQVGCGAKLQEIRGAIVCSNCDYTDLWPKS